MKNRAIFFDRDGVINMRMVKDYVKKKEEFHFLPDFLDFIPKVKKTDYKNFVITNQQGVSKGIMTLDELNILLEYMQNELKSKFDIKFDDLYFCTDLADSGSYYRKPNPGMIIEAVNKWDIDISQSWLIGDSPTDAMAGKKAGLQTILIGNYTKEEVPEADYIVKDFYEIESKVPIF